MNTLSELITKAIAGAEDSEEKTAEEHGTRRAEKAEIPTFDVDEAEKLASVLEFVGRRGIENMLKLGGGATCPPPGTNEGRETGGTNTMKQVPPNPESPPVHPPATGAPPTNKDRETGGQQQVAKATGQDHHPGLASNEAVKKVTKKDKAKIVTPGISAVLDETPFADHTPKELLSHTETDKNIHAKGASDKLALIREELARRVAAARETT